jgi:SAM-dependent methyltransferase
MTGPGPDGKRGGATATAPDAARRFFDAIARRYDRAYAPDRETSRRKLARMLEVLPPRARVLDLGVGTGRELSALLDAGHSPTGLDLSAEMLAICGRRSRPVPLVQADFWQPLPFADRTFDVVLALHGTLAHPPDERAPARLQAELGRVLDEPGMLIAEAPSPEWVSGLSIEGSRVGDFLLRRTGASSCTHDDLVAGVSLEARLLSAQEWSNVFASWREVTVEASSTELFIVARGPH